MANVKLILSYLGSPFLGWQKTKLGPSIEESLEQALQQILQHEVKLQAASRTDAGVHARGQVVNFFTHQPTALRRLKHSLNGLLPKEISILSAEIMPDDFHPTLDCVKKEYTYHLCTAAVQLPFFRHTSWHFPTFLEIPLMRKGAQHLLGSHDFSAFCNERQLWDRDPCCNLEYIEIVSLPGKRICIRAIGDHFLYKMARNIAGILVYIGCGKISADAVPQILLDKDRRKAGITAPAHGLALQQVFYSLDRKELNV